MKITAISDIHMRHKSLNPLPKGDILVCAGDLTNLGDAIELQVFADWLGHQHSFDHILVIAGNHDKMLDDSGGKNTKWFKEYLLNETYGRGIFLDHEAIEIDGVKFFGTPYVPVFCQMGFNREADIRKVLWNDIPEDTDVLISHVPAFGILDHGEETVWDPNRGPTKVDVNYGCVELRNRIEALKNLKLHIFGHIHQQGGITHLHKNGRLLSANAAMRVPECSAVRDALSIKI